MVELLDELLAAARQAGFQVREEWLGGSGGGSCVLRGQKWLFLDLALSTSDRLDVAAQALSADPITAQLELSTAARDFLGIRKSA